MTGELKVDLKNCPFCGGEAIMTKDKQDGYSIFCCNCGVVTDYFDNRDECIKTWNRRIE